MTMKEDLIVKADSVEQAIEDACAQIGKARDEVEVEVLAEPKKSLFGKIKEKAQVKISFENRESEVELTGDIVEYKIKIAQEYLGEILNALGIQNIEQEVVKLEDHVEIILKASNIGVAIGRRGETLDSIQYLVSLVANRVDGDYIRFIIDSGNFRKKREETLKALANKIARKAIKTGRNSTLEPMNPYERRIIHSVITDIDGVYSKSVGEEPNRKVVVICENKKRDYKRSRPRNDERKRDVKYDANYEIPKDVSNKPSTYDFEKEFLKNNNKEKKLYTKIDLDD